MELYLLWTIAQRALRDALRNKWLWFYAVGFGALAFALAQAGMASSGYAGLGGFGRTAASLVNALLLFVPLIGLTVGAGVIAGERERGTLLYLLAQPVNRAEIFFGKALGAALAVLAALALGFGLAGIGLASAGGVNRQRIWRSPRLPRCSRSPRSDSVFSSAPSHAKPQPRRAQH